MEVILEQQYLRMLLYYLQLEPHKLVTQWKPNQLKSLKQQILGLLPVLIRSRFENFAHLSGVEVLVDCLTRSPNAEIQNAALNCLVACCHQEKFSLENELVIGTLLGESHDHTIFLR